MLDLLNTACDLHFEAAAPNLAVPSVALYLVQEKGMTPSPHNLALSAYGAEC